MNMHVIMINLNDISKEKKFFLGHKNSILSLSVSGDNNLLVKK